MRLTMRIRSAVAAAALLAGGLTVVAATPAAAATGCGRVQILGISANASNTLYSWTDEVPDTAGGIQAGIQVTSNQGTIRLMAAEGDWLDSGTRFAVDTTGNLRVYSNGSFSSYVVGATGFGTATTLLAQGNGVLFAVFSDGSLRWYRFIAGKAQTGSGTKIGSGWNGFKTVATGGNGVLYAAHATTGELFWYKAVDYLKPGGFNPRTIVGRGWNTFRALIGAGNGLIYAVTATGDLLWYNHTSAKTGAATWAAGTGTKVGAGWGSYRALTANVAACSWSTGAIRGKVTNSAGVAVKAHVTVSVEGVPGIVAQGGTDSAGMFNFGTLSPGKYRVCFNTVFADSTPTGYVEECHGDGGGNVMTPRPAVTVTAGAVTTDNTTLTTGGAVSGRVVDSTGKPLRGVVVGNWGGAEAPSGLYWETETDANGNFVVKGLVPGSTFVCASSTRNATGGSTDAIGYVPECHDNLRAGQMFPSRTPPASFAVTAGATVAGVNFTLDSQATVAGRVTDAAGAPIATASIQLGMDGMTYSLPVTPDGTWQEIVPVGTYTVCASADGYASTCFDNVAEGGQPTPVVMTPAGSVTVNIALPLV